MIDVTLVTYCCPKDIRKFYAPGHFRSLVDSHKWSYAEIILIRQRCQGIDVGEPEVPCRVLEAEDFPDVRSEFGIVEDNPLADQHCPPSSKYYWKWHCWNQLIGLEEAQTPYVAFTDCDVVLEGDPWVQQAVDILRAQPEIFMVSPGHGGVRDKTQAISQIVFLCDRQQFLNIDYEAPFPPGQEPGMFFFVFEGRLARYAITHKLFRMTLGSPKVVHYAW